MYLNLRACKLCGRIIGFRAPNAKYCQACADEKYAKRRGKRKTYKHIDMVAEFAEIIEYAREAQS